MTMEAIEGNPELMGNAIIELLQSAVHIDVESQKTLDEKILAFEVVYDYPFILLNIVHGKYPCEFPICQMASIFLKNYVSNRLHPDYLSEASDLGQLVSVSQRLLFQLHHVSGSINAILVETLVNLSLNGFWKYIQNDLYTAIKGKNEILVKTSLHFFAELLITERTLDTTVEIDLETFKHLLRLFQSHTSLDIKQSLIDIMCESIVRPFFKDLNATEPILNTLLPILINTIFNPESEEYNFPLQDRLLKRLANCVSHSIAEAYDIFLSLMPSIGQLLLKCCSDLKLIILNTSTMDEDNKSKLYQLIESLMLFINELFVSNEYRQIIFVDIVDIFYCITIFSCCKSHSEFINSLAINEENDDEQTDNDLLQPRSYALSLFTNILPYVGSEKLIECFSSLHLAHEKLLNEYNNGTLYFRIIEAIMTILYEIKKCFPKNKFFSNDQLFTQRNYFNAFTQLFINDNENYIILGRLYLFVSIYSASVDSNTLQIHIRGLLNRLNSAGDVGTSWFLATALRNHLTCVPISTEQNRQVFYEFASEISRCLLRYTELIYIKPELYLPSLGNLINCNQIIVFFNTNNLDEIIQQCLRLHYRDVNKCDQIAFLISCIARYSSTCHTLYNQVIPFLLRLISMHHMENLDDVFLLPEMALDLINTIAIYAAAPLTNEVLKTVFLLVYQKIKEREMDLIHCGSTFITVVILRYLGQLRQINDDEGNSLYNYLSDILMELLDNAKFRMSLQISRVCVILIQTLYANSTARIECILKYIATTLQMYDSMQGSGTCFIITIFLGAFMVRPEQTITFLSSLPGPKGGSAISFILNCIETRFLINAGTFENMFYGMAIMKIINHFLDTADPRMDEITSLNDKYGQDGSGMEYLYGLLVSILVEQFEYANMKVFSSNDEENEYFYSTKTYHRFDEERRLFGFHEWGSVDVREGILSFLMNEQSICYVSLLIDKLIIPREVVEILIGLGLPLTMPHQDNLVPIPMPGVVEEQPGPSHAPME